MMKKLLIVAAAGEAATGLILLVYLPVVVRLLFGAEIAGAGIVMSRIAGISLIALGLACWPALGSSISVRTAWIHEGGQATATLSGYDAPVTSLLSAGSVGRRRARA